MNEGLRFVFYGALVLLSIALFFALLRAIKGPRIADRILGINLCGSISLLMLAILAVLLRENWLLDVGLLYAMISFLAVVVLAKAYISTHQKKEDGNE